MRIGAELRDSERVETITSPYDGSAVAEVCVASATDVDDAIAAAAAAFDTMRRMPSHVRATILERTAVALRKNEDEIATTMARESGMNGVVASARELPAIKSALGSDTVVVTPGIRLPDAAKDDQTRVVTPEAAIRDGADYIVVGRPIIAAPDPVAACRDISARVQSV